MTDNENKDIISEGVKAAAEKELDEFLNDSEKTDTAENITDTLSDSADEAVNETLDKADEVFSDNDDSTDVVWEEMEADSFADEEKLKEAESEIVDELNRKKRKTVTAVLISVIAVVILAVLSFGIYTMLNPKTEEGETKYTGSKESAAVFAGEEISAEELKLFMVFSDNDYDTAVDMLTQYLVYSYAAEKHGITLSEEYRQDVLDYVEEIKQMVSDYGYILPNISDERLFELFSVEYIANEVAEALTSDIEYSDDEYNTFMADYSEIIRLNSSIINVKYILAETEEAAKEAKDALDSGMTPDDAIREYSAEYADVEYDEETQDGETDENIEMEIVIDSYPLQDFGFGEDITDQIMPLEEGQHTDVINFSDGVYLIFIMAEKDVVSDEELAEIARDEYEYSKKGSVFNTKLEEYEAEANIQLNSEISETIRAELIGGDTAETEEE